MDELKRIIELVDAISVEDILTQIRYDNLSNYINQWSRQILEKISELNEIIEELKGVQNDD